MNTQHIWEIKAKNTPLLKKKCNQCNSDRFQCSDKFRLNAQKKNIDIWLIYRCVKCNNTYNMTVFSRIRTESVSKEIFNKFSENDTEIAWQYAFSREMMGKNNVEADWESVHYEIIYPDLTVEDLINMKNETISFQIQSLSDFNMRVSTVLRTCLGLSSSKLNLLLGSDAVYFNQKPLQKKYKITNGDRIEINRHALINIYLMGKADVCLNMVDD
ncbi:hypothetical protein J2795_001916 [Chryseobacterium bernardetii]|uniref:Uncharacterized protein n=2 Tax=Chryseobacterium TaxID=59732 RepID=A0A543EHW6_9FLAO|nr:MULTISPECIES: DUF1062 domain-containing protein [Chryseobacterium]MDR6371038.1 hypothetical protein [Chryseobacterium vietnamense]MDR6441216.1 hypothetical protein [Chryseobacterium bernardetii]TQM21109.1 hypothetical protein FB551_0791 [Chryseobacterium aquifrigidense]